MDNLDQKVQDAVANEAPQMKVMGNAAGSRTTAGSYEPNTDFASRADQPLGAMGNAAGFPSTRDNTSYGQESSGDQSMLDLMTVIRRYPIPALLVGIGLGYLLFSGRSLR
jgi:hypothetical protein